MDDRATMGPFWGAFGGAVALGVLYNQAVTYAQKRGYSDGYMSFIVALGVLLTLILAVPVIGLRAAALVAGLFAGSGAPMMAGSVGRYVTARAEAEAWQRGHAR